jgi:hypothetical protein
MLYYVPIIGNTQNKVAALEKLNVVRKTNTFGILKSNLVNAIKLGR